MAKLTSINYGQYKKLESIIRTDFPNSKDAQFSDIVDMAMQTFDIEQTLIDFCNEHDITEEDLNDS